MNKKGLENIGHTFNRKLLSIKWKNKFLQIGQLKEKIGKTNKNSSSRMIVRKAKPIKKTRKIETTNRITIETEIKINSMNKSKNKSKQIREIRKNKLKQH